MFKFFKKKHQEKKKSKIDKLIMGAILGGAIGSVVGMSIAPKKGKETREYLSQKGQELFKKGQEISEKIRNPNEKNPAQDSNRGFFKKIMGFKNVLLNRLKRGRSADMQKFRKIPNENIEEDKMDIIKF